MTEPSSPRTSQRRVRIGFALTGGVVLVLLSCAVLLPPFSMTLLPLIIGVTEMSPFLVLLDLIWCLVANRLLREHAALRAGLLVALIVGAIVAVIPVTHFTQVAAAAMAQLGTEESSPRFSFLTAIRGLPASANVTERIIGYRAENGSLLSMRLYTQSDTGLRPTVAVIYGGAWRGNDASQCADVSRALAARGFTVAAIDYRHAPTFPFPAQLHDIRSSLQLLRDSAAAWHVDTNRMGLLGRSSGGQLATLTAFSTKDLPLKAVVAIYAPYDLVAGYYDLPSPDPIDVQEVLRDFIGGSPAARPQAFRLASPASYVHPGLPPTLLVFGGSDHIIKPAFNRRAASELRRAHVPVVSVELPWAEHGFDMAPAGLGSQLAFAVITSFLERELKH